MQLQNSKSGKIAITAMLIALAMVFSYIESLVPYPIPGAKMGLTNVVVLVVMYRFSIKDAVFINLIRILLVGITFGNTFSLMYSLAGGLLSLAIMIILKQSKKFSIVIVSIAGGIMHNLGQLMVAMFVLKTKAILSYLPILWVTGILAGICIGILGNIVVKRIPERI